jgi:hypothetical protein
MFAELDHVILTQIPKLPSLTSESVASGVAESLPAEEQICSSACAGGGRPRHWCLANSQAVFGNLTGGDARPTLWRGRPRPRPARLRPLDAALRTSIEAADRTG